MNGAVLNKKGLNEQKPYRQGLTNLISTLKISKQKTQPESKHRQQIDSIIKYKRNREIVSNRYKIILIEQHKKKKNG